MKRTLRSILAAAVLVAGSASALVAAQAPAVYTPDNPPPPNPAGSSIVLRLREPPTARASVALGRAIRTRFPGATMQPSFSVPSSTLEAMMAEARRNSGRTDIPDLRLFQRIELRPGLDANAILRFLRAQRAVTTAYVQQPAAPALAPPPSGFPNVDS